MPLVLLLNFFRVQLIEARSGSDSFKISVCRAATPLVEWVK